MRRIATAVVLVPAVLAAVMLAPGWLFALLLLLLALQAAREFYALGRAAGLSPYLGLGLVLTGLQVLGLAWPWPARFGLAGLLAFVLAVLLHALARPEQLRTALADAAVTLLGALYLGLLLGVVGAIRLLPLGSAWLVFLLLVVWLGDTAAFYVGRAWGGRWWKRPMAPRVSPKKSWEGGLASLAAAAVVGLGVAIWQGAPWLVPLAVVLNLAAQLGDLVESLFKRSAQVKDSGALLPGHGGVLDRVDAMLFAAPVLWCYLAFFHP
ncbi:MAG: phosphatidate cytidylyltransferase [Terriglobales bacterium]